MSLVLRTFFQVLEAYLFVGRCTVHCIPDFLSSCVAQTTTWSCYVSTLVHLKTSTPKEIFSVFECCFSNLDLLHVFKNCLKIQIACKSFLPIGCVRSCDQKPYLHNERKGGFEKIEFNPQKNISLLQHGRHLFVYSSNMAAVTSYEHTLL